MSIEQQLFDYWQARFNVLTDAWRTGDNDSVLKATHEFIKANDSAPAQVRLKTIAELRVECAIYKGRDDAKQLVINQLEAERDQLKSCEVVMRKALRQIAIGAAGDSDEPDDDGLTYGEIANIAYDALAQSQPHPLECGECDTDKPCSNQYGICSRHGGKPIAEFPQVPVEVGDELRITKFGNEQPQFFVNDKPLAGEPSHGGLTQCDMHDDESY